MANAQNVGSLLVDSLSFVKHGASSISKQIAALKNSQWVAFCSRHTVGSPLNSEMLRGAQA